MGKAPKRIQSIERSAALLEIIAQQGGGARLRELAAISGLEKTTAHNILQTLEHLGYVYRRTGDVRYYLGGRILNLSRLVGDDDSIRQKLRPVMDRLAAECCATAYLGVPSGDQVAYLDIVDLKNPYVANSRLDRREKLEGSAVGLVFLAFVPGLGQRVLSTRANALNARATDEIESVRNKGYALDLGAYHPGINAVAVPWRQTGEVRASLCLAGQAEDFPRHRMVHIAWKMMKALEGANVQQY